MDSLRFYIEKMLRLFIFYILFHTTRSAIEFGYERDLENHQDLAHYGRQSKHQKYDQILSNLRSLFKDKPFENNENIQSTDYNNDFTYNLNSENKQEFDEILSEVTSALDKIKEELIKFNNEGVLTVEFPVVKPEKRYKRDVTKITGLNETGTANVTTNVTTTEIPVTVTEKPVALRVGNESLKTEVLSVNNDTNSAVNSRRMISMPMMQQPPEYVATTSRVKDKLLSYLEDTFNEVERKIKPLTNIKIALSNDDHYRIGYIIATIDTLEVNLKKLKNDMNLHQHVWDDEKILDLFDRIKATNTVATSLIESLKKYLPRN